MKKLTAILLTAALTLALTGCGETDPGVDNRTAAPDITTAPPDTTITPPVTPNIGEMRLNTDFLNEFGMTLSEIEQRRGNIISGETGALENDGRVSSFTYFFERGEGRGYHFSLVNNDWEPNAQKTISDGTARLDDVDRQGERIEFVAFNGRVDEVFLGMESTISPDDIEKILGIEISLNIDGSSTFYSGTSLYYCGVRDIEISTFRTTFVHTEYFSFHIEHDKDGVIEPGSELNVTYWSKGVW
jgi:hypothetical protein